MAKSKGFFGIRTGSTKNFTFSELNGEQITKERVSKVKNPRTISQMRQRMLMATIGAAYSYLKAIADHSYEGKTVGQQCMSEFMRLNLNKFRDAAQDDNAAYAMNAYGDKLINPMRYILARVVFQLCLTLQTLTIRLNFLTMSRMFQQLKRFTMQWVSKR